MNGSDGIVIKQIFLTELLKNRAKETVRQINLSFFLTIYS